jgi:signal peptidase I
VKRVIALPGETVSQCGEDQVCIDGKLLDESYLPKGTVTTIPTELPYITGADGKRTLVCDRSSAAGTCKVPAGEIFVMGDNRGNSQDARANGPVKESSIVGRVFLRIWPPDRIGLM